jgi:hypothetical protein
MLSQIEVKKEIFSWADKFNYHMIVTTENLPLFERIVDDAIKLSKGETMYVS